MSGFSSLFLCMTPAACAGGWLMASFPLCPFQLLACVIRKNWKDRVCSCSLQSWREALALLLTYSGPEKFPELCGRWP